MAPIPDAVAVMDQAIADNKVIMFSQSYCPFCNTIKERFKQENITYEAIELDLRSKC